jgi:TRAP transporter TAXI family solute receptor
VRKERFIRLACLVMVLLLSIVGCASNSKVEKDPGKVEKTPSASSGDGSVAFQVEMATSVVGGGWATIGEGLAEAIRRNCPEGEVTVVPSVAPENPVRVDTGDVPLALSEVTTVLEAMHGDPPYNTKSEKVKAIAGIFNSPFSFVISADTGITSFDQILEEEYPLRLSLHSQGSLFEKSLETVFDAYGYSTKDITDWGGRMYYLGWGESCNMIKDGNLDAFGGPGVVPHASTMELATVRDIRLLSVDSAAAEKVNEKLGTVPAVIPTGAYSFLTEDVTTIASIMVLITNDDLSDDVAYSIAKSFHEQLDYLNSFHDSLKDMSAESLVETGGLPLHPGAEKYYKEAGLI